MIHQKQSWGLEETEILRVFLITKLCTIYADKFYIMADLCL